MRQQSLDLGQSNKRTRRREVLGEMERVVPWTELVGDLLIARTAVY